MPTFSLKQLRQSLGTSFLRDTYVGATTASWASTAFSINVIDRNLANLDFAGQNLYQRAWLRVAGADITVASFNVTTGAYISAQAGLLLGATPSGTEYERHELLPPADKDRAIGDVVKRLRTRREVAIPTVQGAHLYSLDAAASPNQITAVFEVYAFGVSTGTLSRDVQGLVDWEVVSTASGTELRIEPALSVSMQLVVLADLAMTLGSDAATINIPDERWFLSGAAAKCYDMLIRRAPGQSRGLYEKDRAEFARAYTRLSLAYAPPVDYSVVGLLEDTVDAF